jgi:phage baseplate assembly protein W|tara:strand:+ start:484 stop:909 length:426 start_codon:yes stop_codon:yes gene_type:complete
MGAIQNDLDPDTYIGIELPLTYGNSGFFKRTKTALEQTRSNIKNLLETNKGERLGNPTFGCDLRRVLFEKEGDIESDIEEAITSAMNEFLPFVTIVEIKSLFSEANPNIVNVSLRFSLNTDVNEEETLALDFGNYESVQLL